MAVLIAVLDDLWSFFYSSLFGTRYFDSATEKDAHQYTLPLSENVKLLDAAVSKKDDFIPGHEYFVGVEKGYVYTDPSETSTVLAALRYGQAVLVRKVGDVWTQAITGGIEGWVRLNDISAKADSVFPKFVTGVSYSVNNIETKKATAFLSGAGYDLTEFLSGSQYVAYKLASTERTLNWPNGVIAEPGQWQKKLRGLANVYSTITPQQGSVMEYQIQGRPFIAYVENVYHDRSIEISEIGAVELGQFTSRILTLPEYKEFSPVFMVVT